MNFCCGLMFSYAEAIRCQGTSHLVNMSRSKPLRRIEASPPYYAGKIYYVSTTHMAQHGTICIMEAFQKQWCIHWGTGWWNLPIWCTHCQMKCFDLIISVIFEFSTINYHKSTAMEIPYTVKYQILTWFIYEKRYVYYIRLSLSYI